RDAPGRVGRLGTVWPLGFDGNNAVLHRDGNAIELVLYIECGANGGDVQTSGTHDEWALSVRPNREVCFAWVQLQSALAATKIDRHRRFRPEVHKGPIRQGHGAMRRTRGRRGRERLLFYTQYPTRRHPNESRQST